MLIKLTDKNFTNEVLNNSIPVIVEFSKSWSGASDIIKPIIDKIMLKFNDEIKFGKIDIDKEKSTPLKFGILNAPAILIFKEGRLLDYISGMFSYAELESLINRNIYNESSNIQI